MKIDRHVRRTPSRCVAVRKRIAVAVIAGLSPAAAQAIPLYWYPVDGVTNVWDTATADFTTATAAGGTRQAWSDTTANDAIFDQTLTYTVTPSANRTAGNLSINAGSVTFDSAFTISNTTTTVASGATMTAAADRFLKSGTTSVVVNGTLVLGGGPASGRLATLTGSGNVRAISVAAGGAFRLGAGTYAFSGNLSDFDTAADAAGANRGRFGLNGNGAAFNLTLSGDNTQATGDFSLNAGGTTRLRLASTTALSNNAHLILGNNANENVVELAAGNFTRVFAAGANAAGQGGVTWGGANAGFIATGADRSLTFVTTPGGSTAADVTFGSNGLTATGVVLATAASTHKLTWTNNIDLGTAARTVVVGDGTADVDSELTGVIGGGASIGLTKSGNGTLLLSNANAFAGPVTVSAGTLRLSNGQALGPNATAKTVALGASGIVQVTGGITVTGKTATINGRTASAATAALVNLGGSNAWNGNIAFTAAGGGYPVRSDGGTFTLGGDIYNSVGDATSNRGLVLFGAGDYAITGLIRNSATVAANLTNLNVGDTVAGSFTGVATVSNTNTYTGGTSVFSGTLRANNGTSSLGTGLTVVRNAGVLAGTGATGGAVSLGAVNTAGNPVAVTSANSTGGTITAGTGASTGDTPGTLTSGPQTWGIGGTYRVKFADSAGVSGAAAGFDRLVMSSLNLSGLSGSGKFNLVLLNSTATPAAGFATADAGTFTIARVTTVNGLTLPSGYTGNDLTGLFALDTTGIGLPDASNFAVSYEASGGGFDINLTAAPEPTTAVLVGLGGMAVLGRRRGRRGA